jgi:gas vesicle protein
VGAEPEELERDIARTRERLGRDVDALTEKVSPAAAAKRRVGRIRNAAASIRENVMGTVTDKAGATGDTLSGVGQGVSEGAAHAKESVAETAQTVKRRAQGNPFAAGVIAFGVGWLVSSLIPATESEEQLGARIRETARDQAGAVKAAAAEVADDLREPAKEAVEQVKRTASDSASTVKDEASGQASDLAGEAQDRGQHVAQTARS